MAGNLTNASEVEVLKWLLNLSPSYTPTNTKLALLTTAPSDDSGTTGAVEVAGNGYARQLISWGTPASGAVANNADITFPTATGSWGTLVAVQIWDNSGSNCLLYGSLAVSKSVGVDDIFKIAAGNLSVSLD